MNFLTIKETKNFMIYIYIRILWIELRKKKSQTITLYLVYCITYHFQYLYTPYAVMQIRVSSHLICIIIVEIYLFYMFKCNSLTTNSTFLYKLISIYKSINKISKINTNFNYCSWSVTDSWSVICN